jgi:hypothetical protein
MKKILSLLSVVIIALCTFTSCDEDLMISTSLKGTWEGYMDTYYDGSRLKQKATYTEIQFFKDAGEKYGHGYWIDHFSKRRGDYYYSSIYWEVRNQEIYIRFLDSNTSIVIHDYELRDKHFTGWFQDDHHTHTDFDLVKTRDDYDSYDHDYGYGDYYSDYYSKATRSGDSTAIEVPVRKFKKDVNK